MYCGNCLRDNALVGAWRNLGHQVTMVPLYLPLRLDEPDLRLRADELWARREELALCRVVFVAFLPPIARELSRFPRAPTRDLPSRSC